MRVNQKIKVMKKSTEEKTTIVPKADTLGDIFNIQKYKTTLMGEIKETCRAIDSSSHKLKRTPFTVLREKGCLNLEYLNVEYIKIKNRESLHSKSERECIISLVEGAVHDTLLWVEDQKQKSIKEVEHAVPVVKKPRTPRKKKTTDE